MASVLLALIVGTTIVVTALLALYAVVITAAAVVARTLIRTVGEVHIARSAALPRPPAQAISRADEWQGAAPPPPHRPHGR